MTGDPGGANPARGETHEVGSIVWPDGVRINMSLNETLKELSAFIKEIAAKGNQPVPSNQPTLWFSHRDLGGLILWEDEVVQYKRCLDGLYKTVAATGYFSRKAVESLLQVAVLRALDAVNAFPHTSLDQRLGESLKELQAALATKPSFWSVHIRVIGLAPAGLPVDIGKVRFYQADEERMSELLDKTNVIIESGTNTPEQKHAFKEDFAKELRDQFGGKVIARVDAEAVDQTAAYDQALRELRLTLDVVNFYADVIHPSGDCAHVFLPGEGDRLVDLQPAFKEGERPEFVIRQSVRGPLADLSLAEMDSDKSAKLGFRRVADILANGQRNSFEDRILSAFQWAGRATIDERREEAFLLYAISLESLLLGSKVESELTYRLRMRCAHLLGLTFEAKQRIQRRVSELYRTRSKIVHSGSVQVTDADLSMIRFYAKNALIAVLTEHQFQNSRSEDDFDQWFEERLLA